MIDLREISNVNQTQVEPKTGSCCIVQGKTNGVAGRVDCNFFLVHCVEITQPARENCAR
jgi:hypothetical protein